MGFPDNFVRVSQDKKHFEVDGKPWYFCGCNWYDPSGKKANFWSYDKELFLSMRPYIFVEV